VSNYEPPNFHALADEDAGRIAQLGLPESAQQSLATVYSEWLQRLFRQGIQQRDLDGRHPLVRVEKVDGDVRRIITVSFGGVTKLFAQLWIDVGERGPQVMYWINWPGYPKEAQIAI
jgi:hypothetical protein